jgi:hypothetical protein
VLIASSAGVRTGFVDLNLLRELQSVQLDVDFTENLGELTWDRIRAYNVLVLTITPDALDVIFRSQPSSPAKIAAFDALIDRYLAAGGGILLFPSELHTAKQALADLTTRLGAQLPPEWIEETEPKQRATMAHAPITLAFTDRVTPSPVTRGVKGIWYPTGKAFFSGFSGPIVVDDHWQVLVRAAASARTQAVDMADSPRIPSGLLVRAASERGPALVAVRELGNGRVGLINQWQQFSFGAGTRWVYDRQVLERGASERPSDFGLLLRNLLHWLAEPSQRSHALGGYASAPERLLAPNARASLRDQYRARAQSYEPAQLMRSSANRTPYRGLIGLRTNHGGGRDSVTAYAAAARELGLDFLVFLDPFARLDRERFAALVRECKAHSGERLLLLPGFTIDSNIGSHLFFYGPDPAWPPDNVLTGPDHKELYVQQLRAGGTTFTGFNTPYFNWALSAYLGPLSGQIGLYDFAHAARGPALTDAVLSSAVALRLYRRGRLVEDLLPAYLETAQSSAPPTPLAMHEIDSVGELREAVKAQRSLSFASAVSLDPASDTGLFKYALRWAHEYDAVPVSVSAGPRVERFSGRHRVMTYGGEGASPELALMTLSLRVSAVRGLRELRIYDGTVLLRRYRPTGARSFERTLLLDGAVQKNLILVAEDQRGGSAVSAVVRSWAEDSDAVVFCGDYVNDCHMLPLLAHGPFGFPLNHAPPLSTDFAGGTWDGGPRARLPLIEPQETRPRVETSDGMFDLTRATQVPRVEASDEGATALSSHAGPPYGPHVEQVVNPWHTFGPIDRSQPPALHSTVRYRSLVRASLGPQESEWAALGDRTGVSISLLETAIEALKPLTIKAVEYASLGRNPAAKLAIGGAERVEVLALAGATAHTRQLAQGDWFAVFGAQPSNAQWFLNRGGPLRLEVHERIRILGGREPFSLLALGFPLDLPVTDGDAFGPYLAYLRDPTGLTVTRGQRLPDDGLLTLAIADGAVALALPRAANVPGLALPVRLRGLNPRWSAGFLQREGYTAGFYGTHDRYRGLAVEPSGLAHLPLYVDRADRTDVVAGHPVIADDTGRELFIQATNLGGDPWRWHISVNNPTERRITTVLHNAMQLPGIAFSERSISVEPGADLVLQ